MCIDPIPEHVQDALFTVETIPVTQLRAEQGIERPQGLDALVDDTWEYDEGSRLLLASAPGQSKVTPEFGRGARRLL